MSEEKSTDAPPTERPSPDRPGAVISRSALRIPRILLLTFLAFLLATASIFFAGRAWLRVWAARPYGTQAKIPITIPAGTPLKAISARLQSEGVIDHQHLFTLYAISSRRHRSLQAGDYVVPLPVRPGELLDLFRHGTFQRSLTVPEGWTAAQIGRMLLREGWIASETAWMNVVAESLPPPFPPAGHAEGFCFPDTYQFEPGITVEAIRDRMLAQFLRVWESLEPDRRDPRSERLSMTEVVTLASLVEREARRHDELPRIASVFLNRLKIRMRLQSCATVHYALGEVWDRPLAKTDLEIDSPYNTYRIHGLPPGPIGNPGRHAIEAVLRPAPTDDLYFVYRGDGTHEFTRSYRDHLAAARRYRSSDPTAEHLSEN